MSLIPSQPSGCYVLGHQCSGTLAKATLKRSLLTKSYSYSSDMISKLFTSESFVGLLQEDLSRPCRERTGREVDGLSPWPHVSPGHIYSIKNTDY